jgi:hypothetical protein
MGAGLAPSIEKLRNPVTMLGSFLCTCGQDRSKNQSQQNNKALHRISTHYISV